MLEDAAQALAAETKPVRRKVKKKKSAKETKGRKSANGATKRGVPLGYPKHPILKCLRIPQAVLENNAGKECTDREAAKFASIGWSGQVAVEISSAIKYGLFERPSSGKVKPTPWPADIPVDDFKVLDSTSPAHTKIKKEEKLSRWRGVVNAHL